MRHADTIQKWVVSLGLAVAGVSHLAAGFDHRRSPLLVALFVAIGVVQFGSAIRYLGARARRVTVFVATTTVALLVAWVASRTVGLAIGHSHGPERAAALDSTAVAAQLTVLFGLVHGRSPGATSWRRGVTALAVVLLVAGVASRSLAPAGHHPSPYAGTSEPAPDGPDVDASAPASSSPTVQEPDVEPAASTAHDHCSGAGCQPHHHP